MTIDSKLFSSVCDHARQATVLQTTADTLEWDERTGMPSEGGQYRATQVSTLRGMVHAMRTDTEYGENVTQLANELSDDDTHDVDRIATVRHLDRDYKRDSKLPTDLVQRVSEATVKGQQVWDAARKADDFSMFRDQLATVIDLKTEVGNRLREGTDKTAYEALMDEYESDAKESQIQSVFDSLRGPLVELIAAIADAPKRPNVDLLKQNFGIDGQRSFSRQIAERVGFDFDAGRLDETSHPFCTTLGPEDIRILTRFESNWLPSGIFGTLHEAGHGMYEQGLRSDWFGLAPGNYASLGIHESQSRLWENQVGRSREFWQASLADLQATFPSQLGKTDLDEFYFAVNAVQPSLIRVEADEATYNLHIIIRFDLERQLISGQLSIDELPEAWNARYQSDLGICPSSDADGVLQDVHWSAGLIGYFPTYTLGNVASAQLFNAAAAQISDLPDQFSRGDFQPLLRWLNRNVHAHGRCYSGDELVEKATGQAMDASHLIEYLKSKLSPLYGF